MNKRDIGKVIDAVLGHVPEERTELRARLQRIKSEAGYLPPEYMYPAWHKLMSVLVASLHNPPTLDWEKRISDIVEGREAVE